MNKTELLAVIYNNTSKDSQRDDIIDAVEKYLSASNFWVETDKGSFAIYKIESGASNPFISYVKQLAIPIESPTSTAGAAAGEILYPLELQTLVLDYVAWLESMIPNVKKSLHPQIIQKIKELGEYKFTPPTAHTEELSREGQGKEVTAITEFINWMESYREAPAGTISEQDCIDKATELLAKEREQIINARLSVTGLNHASPTDDNNLKDAETYFTNTY